MKVKELIEKLQRCDLDMDVCVRGLERGLTEVTAVSMIGIIRDANKSPYHGYGEHEMDFRSTDKVVYISR